MRPLLFTSVILIRIIIPLSSIAQILPDISSVRYNSYRQEVVRVPNIKDEAAFAALPLDDKLSTVNYVDGLGRMLANIRIGFSADQKDIYSISSFDQYGRADSLYLPFNSGFSDGRFLMRWDAIQTQRSFYNNTPNKVADDSAPFGVNVYEASPLNILKESGMPGGDWQPGNQHSIRTSSRTNIANEFRIWKADGSSPGFYPVNSLIISETIDQNGNKVVLVSDKVGRLLEKHVQVEATSWLKTLYVYDDFGRLRLLLQPEGVRQLSNLSVISTALLNQYAYSYLYDARGRLTESKLPGNLVVYYGYDPLDRLVLIQDGNLRSANKWCFLKYDFKGRVVMQGVYTNTTHTSRTAIQTNVLDPLYPTPSSVHAERKVTAGLHGYTNLSFPTSNAEIFSVTYYDDYDLNMDGIGDFTYEVQGLANEASPATGKGRVTASKLLILETSSWLTKYYFYDVHGRVIQIRSNNHLSSAIDNLSTAAYNFDGSLNNIKEYHNAGTAGQLTITNRFEYDHAGRTQKIFQNNGTSEQLLAQYEYNDLGQLVDKKLHLVSGTAFLQSIDYRYSIHGWLKSINNAKLISDAANDETNDYFGEELLYNTTESGLNNQAGDQRYWNGNISAAKWKLAGTGSNAAGQRSHKYLYDKSDRLTSAKFQAFGGTTWNKEANTLNELMAYDHNGNITSLQRNRNVRGLSGTTVTSAVELIDNLTYDYAAGSNGVTRIEDSTTGTAGLVGFNNGSSDAAEFSYDQSGNMSKDLNKGILSIVYNVIGKVKEVNFSDGRKVSYGYDAGGTRLWVKTFQGSTPQTSTEYVGRFVYENGALAYFSSPEGRVVKNGSALEYQYAISDHLGNTRVLFSSVTPAAPSSLATFEGGTGDASSSYLNVDASFVVSFPTANKTPGGSKVIKMNQTYKIGPSKSLEVYPGDRVDIQVWEYHEGSSGFGTSSTPLSTLITSVAGAFGGVSGASGESGQIFSGVNSAITGFGSGGNQGDTRPGAYLNFILFDKDYKVLDAGWRLAPATTFTKQKLSFPTKTITEAGYLFVWLSYDNASANWVYFDDLDVVYTPTNVIQYNEYYAYGLQTNASWTRGQNRNNYLFNEGSELNTTTGWYEMAFRGYDPATGRMLQMDPMAAKYASSSGYNYAFNNPVLWNDPSGADPDNEGPIKEIHQPYIFEDPHGSRSAIVVNGRLMNPRNVYGQRTWAGSDLDYFHYMNAVNGFGATQGISVGGVPLSAYGRDENGRIGYWVDLPGTTTYEYNAEKKKWEAFVTVQSQFVAFDSQQAAEARFGFPEIQGSTELALAGLKPTFDRAAHFARSQGGRGQVPLYLIKNVFKSPLLENNKAQYIGRVYSSTALRTANTLGKVAPALTGLGVITNGYDIVKDGQLTAGDAFQALNTGLMIAFPAYGVAYGVLDLGVSVFTGQSLTDRIKTGIDSSLTGSVAIPKF